MRVSSRKNPKVIAARIVLDEWRKLGFEYPNGVKLKFVAAQLALHLKLKVEDPSSKIEVAQAINPWAFRNFNGAKKAPTKKPVKKYLPERIIGRLANGRPIEGEIRAFYASWEWKRLSFDVKLERGRKCECCGAAAPAVRIHTDHIKPIRYHWELRLDKSNLQVLCEDCNMGKGSRNETDFRLLNDSGLSEANEPNTSYGVESRFAAIREQLKLN